jgi:signal transduction histidine kinase
VDPKRIKMTLKTRIAVTFSLITAFIVISLSISIYWFSYTYNEIHFFDRLHERVRIASQYYIGESQLGAKFIEEIRQQHLQLLPEESEYILPFDSGKNDFIVPDSVLTQFGSSFIQEIIEFKSAEFRSGDILAFGKSYTESSENYLVIVSAYDRLGVEQMSDLRSKLILLFVIYLIAVFILGRIYATQILKPIKRIIQKVNQIRSNNLFVRLEEEKEHDEIGEIALTFNRLLDRVETTIEIQNNFISNASHELKNPLTAILGELEITLSKSRTADEYRSSMENISREASRLHSLTLHLLRLAQTSFDESTITDQDFRIDELLFDIKQDLEESNPNNQIQIILEDLPENPDDLLIRGNEDLIKIALTNIIENGCKFSKNDLVTVNIERNPQSIIVIVDDKGVGIPKDELKNIYVPFFRASNVRMFNGFGIGLPLTNKIISMHLGELHFTSEVNLGTTARITLIRSNSDSAV